MIPSSRREEYLRKKRKILYVKISLFLSFLILVCVSLVFISRMERFRISNVEFVGGLLIAPQDVKEETENFLKGNYFWFFPKNNFFIYPKDELKDFLQDRFKRIDKIVVDTSDKKTVRISITERGMYAMWCKNTEDIDFSEKCYFMDDNGVIFSEAPTFSGDAYFKYYGFFATSTNPIGQVYLSSTTIFAEISNFVGRVKDTTINPVGLLSKEAGEFDLLLPEGGKIYFDNLQSFDKTAENLETLLKTIHSTTTDLNVDYIDLRFGNKLFYKLK